MPITFQVNHQSRRVHTVATGVVTYGDVEHHLFEEEQQSGLSYPELIDAREAIFRATPGDARQVVGLLRGLSRITRMGPTAIVVSSDFAIGLVTLIAMLVEDIFPLRIFRDEGSAIHWLTSLKEE